MTTKNELPSIMSRQSHTKADGKNTAKSFHPLEPADRLPKGWHRVKLGDVTTVVSGTTPKSAVKEFWNGAIVWVTPTDLGKLKGDILTDSERRVSEKGFKSCNLTLVPKGSVVLSSRAPIGHLAISGVPLCTNQGCKSFVPSGEVDALFLFYALKISVPQLQELGSGATFAEVSKRHVENFEIPLPPLAEQKRIAGILKEQMAAVEKARAAAEAQLGAARALPAAYLREVFESDEAKGWVEVTLDQAARLLPSKSIASDGDAEVNSVTTACLTESGFDPAGIKGARMRSSDVPLCILEDNEILIARSNTPELVGRVSVYKGEPKGIVAADLTIRIMASDTTSPDYLSMYLSYLYLTGYWRDHAGGASSTMKKITRTQISALEIPLPDHSRQKIIADALFAKIESARITLAIVQQELVAINALPGAILRKAFNGEF